MKRIRHVLYASDFSAASRRAFGAAISIAKSLNAKLTIVYVLALVVPIIPDRYIDAATLDRLDERARRWSAQQLNRLAARATKAGLRVTSPLREGDPVDQIVRTGRSAHADLIVVGTHGRRGLPKFFLGSVAERVVATRPALS